MPRSTTHTIPPVTLIEQLCEGVIEAGWLAALAVAPLLFNPYAKLSFEPAKGAALRSIVMVMVAAWVVKVVSGGRPWRRPVTAPLPGDESMSWHSKLLAGIKTPLVLPAVAICMSLLLSTALSVDPGLSFWGSHSRSHGLLTQLSQVALFALVLTHLRTLLQWRRVTYVVVVSSVPVALYAVIQRLGLDPISWPEMGVRVGSTLGNPIFLGAYLMIVMFITARETVDRLLAALAKPTGAGRQRTRQLTHVMLLAGAGVLQLAAFVLAQSRGPMLGLIAGGVIIVPVAVLRLRPAAAHRLSVPRWKQLPRWARALSLVAAAALVVLLAFVTFVRPQLVGLAARSGLARLATPLSLKSITAETRMLIWQGAIDVIQDERPLQPPYGEPDPLHRTRALIGYGPETFGLALNRHLAPRLVEVEQVRTTPDRAHNVVLDQLVTTGVIGLVARLALYCTVFFCASAWLGLLSTPARRYTFAGSLTAGALLGAVLPVLLWHKPALAAAGMAAGAVLGLTAFVVGYSAVERRRRAEPSGSFTLRESLILTVLALTIAHAVELQFGIAITVTSLYLWFMIAVLVVAGLGWLEDDGPRRSVGARSRGSAKAGRRDAGQQGHWLPALLVASPALCLIYGFLTNWTSESAPLALVKAALIPDIKPTVVRAALWFAGWIGAVLLARHLQSPEGVGRRETLKLAAASLFLPGLYLVLQATRLTWPIRARQSGTDIVTISEHISFNFSVFVWALLVAVIVAAVVMAMREERGMVPARSAIFRAAACAVILGVATAGLIVRLNLDPIRADALLKHGQLFAEAGQTQVGLTLLERAADLAPFEPLLSLHAGRASMAAARNAGNNATLRRRHLVTAENALVRARFLSPLDPDHTANLARCLVVQGTFSDSPEISWELHRRAASEFEQALRLRPTWPRVMDEYAGLLRAMGKTDEADDLARRLARPAPGL